MPVRKFGMMVENDRVMRSAFEHKHVSSVKVWVLQDPATGKIAGRIVCNMSDNPAGSVHTATFNIWHTETQPYESGTGSARGYGYDKTSAALYDAIKESGREIPDGFSGGDGRVTEVVKAIWGLDAYSVI